MRPLCLVGALMLGAMLAPPAMAQNPLDSIVNFFGGGDETEPGDGTVFDDAGSALPRNRARTNIGAGT